jgi:asparagine synthase (glutamine-hydrolysing)
VSVQFGRWKFDGEPLAPNYIERVQMALVPYGPDGGDSYSRGGVDIIYRALHTTKESRRETQPHVSKSGAVITWDGRLDNRADFMSLMTGALPNDSSDALIVAAAYERWGTDCLARLIGDWTLSIWNPNERSVILAKDPVGTHHLYYSLDESQVFWSSILDPLVLFAGKTFLLDEEYIAGWFSSFPATHLTPYVGIHSVPPSYFVCLGKGRQVASKHWDFDPTKRIRYSADAEYEEQFRSLFAQSVRRRLRSEAPIVAELSGGMDSSSIVCMADNILAQGEAQTPRLDTISYYSDSEPNWNERPYFTKVEEKRGRTGCHINVGSEQPFKFEFETDSFAPTPGSASGYGTAAAQLALCMTSDGNRVLLSGIGGDEVTGGVPTPIPELADLLARARFTALAHQLRVWALSKRQPWFHLLLDTARAFLSPALVGLRAHMRPVPWLNGNFVNRHRAALRGYESRLKFFGSLPSFQENVSALDALRRQLASLPLRSRPLFEQRYPYLDRNLLEFLFAIPRKQLVRPGQRRSVMRRALVGLVPDEILNRKRKAFVVRTPMEAISMECASLLDRTQRMVSSSLGIVDSKQLCEVLQNARRGLEVPIVPLMRTFSLEAWLMNLNKWNVSFKRPMADHRPSARASVWNHVPSEGCTRRDSIRLD